MLNQSPQLDRSFQALADPTRRGIVARLSRGPASVSEIARPLQMSLPAVLQHLKLLEESGLVRSEKQGRVRTVRIEGEALAATENWLAELRHEWESRLDRFEAHVAEMKSKGE